MGNLYTAAATGGIERRTKIIDSRFHHSHAGHGGGKHRWAAGDFVMNEIGSLDQRGV